MFFLQSRYFDYDDDEDYDDSDDEDDEDDNVDDDEFSVFWVRQNDNIIYSLPFWPFDNTHAKQPQQQLQIYLMKPTNICYKNTLNKNKLNMF